MCGLAAMLPVVVVCVLLRRRLPLYAAVVAVGLHRQPSGVRHGDRGE
jgi:hypothetical protein